MADSSLMPAVIGLGGTIVGSAIVLTSQWLLERRKQETEKKNKKAEKLEELVAALHDHFYWLKSGEEIKYNDPHPWAKIEAIQYVYFPEFSDLSKALWDAETSYIRSKKERIPGEEFDEIVKRNWLKYSVCFNSYVENIENYAKREFQ
jgi:hypothetical protein